MVQDNSPEIEVDQEKEKPVETRADSLRRLESIVKLTAWIVIVLSASFHIYRLFQYESSDQTCPVLFSKGYWIGNQWQPDGCLMHQYTRSEIRTCLKNQKIVFIGDSRMRSLYFQLVDSVSQNPVPTGTFHENLQYEDKSNTSIKFKWIPKVSEEIDKLLKMWMEWTIKEGKLAQVVDYGSSCILKAKLSKLAPLMNDVAYNMTVTAMKDFQQKTSRFHHHPQFIWIMQDPVVEELLNENRKIITNDKIDMYNYQAQSSLSSGHLIKIMKATTKMAEGKPHETKDGLHYTEFILKWKVDALLNAFCNDYIYPDDASCCKDPERITKLQFNAFAFLATCVILWVIMIVLRKWYESKGKALDDEEAGHAATANMWLFNERLYIVIKSLAKLAAIMLYIFLADSSLLYNKEHKLYTHSRFFVPLAVLFVVGVVTREPVKQSSFLNPDQLEEWKGWMIIIVMLYMYTGAEQVLPIFVNVRLLVASFLFMIGFAHFRHFWYEGDYGLYKVCQVMTQLNVFCVVMCLVMGHPYQFYVLIPLLSFWFIMVYVFMAVFPRISDDVVKDSPQKNFLMLAKFTTLFVIVFVVWGYENICEKIFSQAAVRELFVDSSGQIQQWRTNSGLNRYSVLFGMVCSYIYVTLKRYGYIDDDNKNVGMILKPLLPNLIALVFALAAVLGYQIQAFTCHSRSICDQTHTLASCLPILGYVFLRNIPGFIRTKYSVFFAWVGRMALELFIAQYHIWLSNDTHGLHVLIPGYPVINATLTTFTFVCVVHTVKKICGILSEELVTKDVVVMLKRLCLFMVMLVIIWWHKTHEKKPELY